MNNTEANYLQVCKKEIESQLNWNLDGNWKQRDFLLLSEYIFEKTGTQLSVSTLKRIWSTEHTILPQTATLNALARFIDYDNWNQFKSSVTLQQGVSSVTVNRRPRLQPRLLFAILIIIMSGGFILFWIGKEKKTADPTPKVDFDYRIITQGIPNSVIFSFDLSHVKADSIFFQQTWNQESRIPIPATNRHFTSIYYYPGYHISKLIADNEIISEKPVHITTKGWFSLLMPISGKIEPLYVKDIIPDHQLYISRNAIQSQHVNFNEADFRLRHYNIRDFDGIDAENFMLRISLKNSLGVGSSVCQEATLFVFCEKGIMMIPFSALGCISNLKMIVGDNFIDGKNNDLSDLGLDLNLFQKIEINSSHKNVFIKTPKSTFKVNYKNSLNKIKGFMIEFRGSGSINEFELFNVHGKKIYSGEFK